MGFDYVPVPWPAEAPDPQPEMRRELEDVGFRLLGGCSLTGDGIREVARVAKTYGDGASEFERWAREPGQVLSSPDGTTFVQLAWLWDCRYATFTSVLGDGRIVQTMTDWDAAPRWPTSLGRRHRTLDVHREQQILATDLDVRVVPGDALATWRVHQERLAGLPAPPPHVALADFARIQAAESRARSSWARRVQVVSFLLCFVLLLVPFVAVSAALGRQPWWVDLGVLATTGLLFMGVYVPIWSRVRGWRGLRRRFRAPVPGARTTA